MTPQEYDAIGRLAEDFQTNMMDRDKLLHLAPMLDAYPWDGSAIVVEIGTYAGSTAVFMAKVLELLKMPAKILSIDPFERARADDMNPAGSYTAYLANVKRHAVGQVCMPLSAYSQSAYPVVPDRIGLLLIDGSHHYAAVRHDLERYGPKVLPGGLVFIDDYEVRYPDVIRATDEYFKGSDFDLLHVSRYVIERKKGGTAG